MTVGILIPIPREFVLTAAANTLAGAELYVYQNLTTTPVTLYSDRACTTPAANPIVSVAGFFPRRYMAAAQLLTLTLKNTAGSTIHSDDYVSGFQEADALIDALAALTSAPVLPQGRLTLESGVGVSTSDQSAKTTVYYTPYQGNLVPIYDGTQFIPTAFTELSQLTTDSTKSPAAVANNSNYDLFVWSDSGTLRCTRGPAWTSDTGRGTGAATTELELVKGLYLNKVAITNGPAANRGTYVGTVRSNSSAQINDSVLLRMVWNAYNRRPRAMQVFESTDTWTYSTQGYRQMNNSAANQLAFVRGLNEDAVEARVLAAALSSGGTVRYVKAAVGLDSTTTRSGLAGVSTVSSSVQAMLNPSYYGFPGLGYHYLAALEYGGGTDTQTWVGDSGTTTEQSGIIGQVFA